MGSGNPRAHPHSKEEVIASVITLVEFRALYVGDPRISFGSLAVPLYGAHEAPISIRNITGLEPAPATINSRPRGSLDGEYFLNTHLNKRNIVFTLGANPNLGPQSVDDIRNNFYAYVTPTKLVGLRFTSDNRPPREIRGWVESIQNDRFSSDPQLIVSVICPDPAFVSLAETTVTGILNGAWKEFVMQGNLVTGFTLFMPLANTSDIGPDHRIYIETGTSIVEFSQKLYELDRVLMPGGSNLEMNSIRGQKFIQYSFGTHFGAGINEHSLLDNMTPESLWPYLVPGYNRVRVRTPDTTSYHDDWELKYFEAFGSV